LVAARRCTEEIGQVSEPRVERWASVLVGYSIDVKPGDTVAITGGVAAEPLLRAIYREVVARGGLPVMIPSFAGLTAELIAHGTDEQLGFLSPVERFGREGADALIVVAAETNTRSSSGVDPARQRVYDRARTGLRQTYLDRAASGALRWSSTLYPTDAYAQDAEMATADFAEYVFAACKLNAPDPVAAWRALHDEQTRLIDWFADKDEIHVVGPGTDLRLSVKGRTWINSDGHRNFPSGEIFTGPIEGSAEGQIRCSYPVVTQGREIVDVRLRFKGGKVVDAAAAKNEDYLLQTLETDAGARFLGEFAFGTNTDVTRFTRTILLDEKIGGTVHLAIGSGYPDSGSTNRSAIHWDLICDLRQGGTVTVDGELFLKDGRIVI
jgi:aminopeptidase